MVSLALKQAIIAVAINNLIDRKPDFKAQLDDPESYFTHVGRSAFAHFVWEKAEKLGAIPDDADDIADQFDDPGIPPADRVKLASEALLEHLAPDCRQKIETGAYYVVLYGRWVHLLRSPGRPDLPPRLRLAIKGWTEMRLPADVRRAIDMSEAVDKLAESLRREIAGGKYRFDVDLFTWMIPHLAEASIKILQPFRPEVDGALRRKLEAVAEAKLNRLRDLFGIYGLVAKDLVDRTLLSVIQAELPVYTAHKRAIAAWALDTLAQQTLFAAQRLCQPRMDVRGRWGIASQDKDLWELRKRHVFLTKFLDIVQNA